MLKKRQKGSGKVLFVQVLKREGSETLEDVEAGRYPTLTTISLKPATTLKTCHNLKKPATTLKT